MYLNDVTGVTGYYDQEYREIISRRLCFIYLCMYFIPMVKVCSCRGADRKQVQLAINCYASMHPTLFWSSFSNLFPTHLLCHRINSVLCSEADEDPAT
jgi:hypothetical protein